MSNCGPYKSGCSKGERLSRLAAHNGSRLLTPCLLTCCLSRFMGQASCQQALSSYLAVAQQQAAPDFLSPPVSSRNLSPRVKQQYWQVAEITHLPGLCRE